MKKGKQELLTFLTDIISIRINENQEKFSQIVDCWSLVGDYRAEACSIRPAGQNVVRGASFCGPLQVTKKQDYKYELNKNVKKKIFCGKTRNNFKVE